LLFFGLYIRRAGMASPHTYTANYGLLKIGIGSNAFDNPYHDQFGQSMDIIDNRLYIESPYNSQVVNNGTGFIESSLGGLRATGVPCYARQRSFQNGLSIQTTTDIGQQPFSSGSFTQFNLSVAQIVAFPVIVIKGFPTKTIFIEIMSGSGIASFKMLWYLPYSENNGPGELLASSSTWVTPAAPGLWQAGAIPNDITLGLPGRMFWGAIWVRGGSGGTLTIRGMGNECCRSYGGYSSSGVVAGATLFAPWEDPDLPPDGTVFYSAGLPTPVIYRTL
jgi:hypothetical protein